MRRRTPGLVPLRSLATDVRSAAEFQAERRIERIWPLLVGPVLVRSTRLIRLRQGTLVLGCWKTEALGSLRQSAAATWPQVQARLERLLNLRVRHLEIVPCDPPPEPQPERTPPPDPLEAVLLKYRALRKQGWTPRPK